VSELPALPALTPGRYRHYKGGEYEVSGVVRHSESLEPMVLYRPLGRDTGAWVRPLSMFLETVEHEGRRQPRFALVAAAVPLDEAQLAETVDRMTSRLEASASVTVRQLMQWYRPLARRFETDLAGRSREVLLARASALMLVQAAAQAKDAR